MPGSVLAAGPPCDSREADDVAFLEAEVRLLEKALAKYLQDSVVGGTELTAQCVPGQSGQPSGRDADADACGALTTEEKLELLSEDYEAVQASLAEAKQVGEEAIAEIAADREEANSRIAEIKHDMYELKRDVIQHAGCRKMGQVSTHSILKYLKSRLTRKEDLTEKLQIKCSASKAQATKVEQQLQQREALGEALMPVDFDQLVIENRQCMDRLQSSNTELLALKATTGKAMQVLTSYKTALAEVLDSTAALQKDIAAKQDQLDKFAGDRSVVCRDHDNAARLLRNITAAEHDSDLPQILDMIVIKAESTELEAKVADLKRKLKIAEMDATRTRRLYQTAMTRS